MPDPRPVARTTAASRAALRCAPLAVAGVLALGLAAGPSGLAWGQSACVPAHSYGAGRSDTWVPRAWMSGAAAWRPVIEPAAKTPELGYTDASLSPTQLRALRRGLKLPLDALADIDSIDELKGRAVVQPLADPSRPFLAVPAVAGDDEPAGELGDPFVSSPLSGRPSTAPRTGLGALSRLFEAEDAAAGISKPAPAAPVPGADVAGDADPFEVPADSPAEPTDEADPFEAAPIEADEAAGDDPAPPAEADPAPDAEDDPFADF
ncbi:MAG: hypothetical protein ACRCT8_01705 [Lacipirellulaceae bacterium]